MATVISLNFPSKPSSASFISNSTLKPTLECHKFLKLLIHRSPILCKIDENPNPTSEEEVDSTGVKLALSVLRFYKKEISPLLLKSCRYVPMCSEYSMIAYKKYGFVKGSVLTACRICRCNPLGGSGFDPPRWFDEENPLEE